MTEEKVNVATGPQGSVWDALAFYLISMVTNALPVYLNIIWFVYAVMDRKVNIFIAGGILTMFTGLFMVGVRIARNIDVKDERTQGEKWKDYMKFNFPMALAFGAIAVIFHTLSMVVGGI